MSLPYFFIENLSEAIHQVDLDEDTSRHVTQVLRMQEGDRLRLTDGRGHSAQANIFLAHKKHTSVQVTSFESVPAKFPRLTIAISLVKNASRFEWFLEKATEFGTAEIIPLICERTERQKFRHDRMMGICRSAMLQSLQTWLPQLHEPILFNEVLKHAAQQQKFIAHCVEDEKADFAGLYNPSFETHIVLIGPEGDFTEKEIDKSREYSFVPVSLGSTRLRTETAGIFAAAWVNGAKREHGNP